MKLSQMSKKDIVNILLDKLSDRELASFIGLTYKDFLKLNYGEITESLIETVEFAVISDIKKFLEKHGHSVVN